MKHLNQYINIRKGKSTIKATDKTIYKIVKDELDKLGHTADLNHIDVRGVTSMNSVFGYICRNLSYDNVNPDISRWDVSNVKDMRFMFFEAKMFNCDIGNWDVSNAKIMHSMFFKCENFNQDLSQWDVRNVEDMNSMFYHCKRFIQDLSSWKLRNTTLHVGMFDGSPMPYKFMPGFER